MGKFLFTADLHLTTHPRDAYRWEIFPWLETQVMNRVVTGLFLLGDLTEQKDNHPAKLTNRLLEAIRILARMTTVVILKGNHDYVDPDVPYFRFLKGFRNVHFLVERGEVEVDGSTFLCLPHTKSWRSDWRKMPPLDAFDFILIHQALRGAKMANGYEVDGAGAPSRMFNDGPVVIAGDIHVPQWVGNVVYCGSPHPVDFGDDFEPRVLLWDGKLRSIKRTTLKKRIVDVTDPDRLDGIFQGLTEGDQVRVGLKLKRSEFHLWRDLKQTITTMAQEKGLVLCGVKLQERASNRIRLTETPRPKQKTPVELFDAFCEGQKIDPALAQIGREVVSKKRSE